MRGSQATEQDPQHRVDIGHGAEGGPRVGPEPFLIDDDRGGQAFENVDVGPTDIGHEPLHERAVGFVDHALRLGGDGAEHERTLARPRHPGEHRQPTFGQFDVDVLEVVLTRSEHPDGVVRVGGMDRLRSCGLTCGHGVERNTPCRE